MGLGTGGPGCGTTLVPHGLRLWPGPRRLHSRSRALTTLPLPPSKPGAPGLPALEDPRVVVADRGEQPQQVLAGLVALVAGGPAHQVDQPVERVLDVPAEHVEVGDQGLRVDVVGVGAAAASRAALRSTPWVRWSTLAMARPPAASVSAGLASTSFWYSATARRCRPPRGRLGGA